MSMNKKNSLSKDDVLDLFASDSDDLDFSGFSNPEDIIVHVPMESDCNNNILESAEVADTAINCDNTNLKSVPRTRGVKRKRGGYSGGSLKTKVATPNVTSKQKPSFRRPRGKINSNKLNRNDNEIASLKQKLGLNQLEQSINMLSKSVVNLATKSNTAHDLTNLPQHEFVDRDFALGAPSQAGYNEAVRDFDINKLNTNSVFNAEDNLDDFWEPELENDSNNNDKTQVPFNGNLDDDDENWDIPQTMEDSNVGPKISDKLATTINRACTKPPDENKFKEVVKRHPRPENCELLVPPRVNGELWNCLGRFKQTQDVGLQEVQKSISSGMIPICKLAQVINKLPQTCKEQKAECKGLITDAISMFGNSMYSLSLKRRTALKSGLNKRYQSICSVDTPITKSLFGDDLDKKLKNLDESNKRYLGKKNQNQSQYQGNMYQNQYGNSNNYRARNARSNYQSGYGQSGFLEQSGPTMGRGRYSRQNSRPYNYGVSRRPFQRSQAHKPAKQ